MAPSKTKPSTPRLSEAARHLVIPSGIVTTGWPQVLAKGLELGIGFDWWQDSLGRVILGKRATGKYAATVGGIVMSIPRQVGKTYFVGAVLMILCVLFPGYKVVWTAHRTRTATNTFRSLQRMAKRKKVWPHILHIRTANGEQEIAFRNGSVIMFGAREQGFGRGFDEIDAEVFDEAQILTVKALEDMVAATNQSRHPHGALLFYMGTPPRPVDPGEAFTEKRAKALAGKSKDMLYLECSAEPGSDPDDRKQWARANFSYPTRTPLESMLRLRENLPGDEAWLREGLGIWDELARTLAVVPADIWFDHIAKELPAADLAPTAIGLDRWHDGTTAIAGAWRQGQSTHVELLALDAVKDAAGVVEWVAERAGRKIPVLIAADSPAASLAVDLIARKVLVQLVSGPDFARSCQAFVDDAIDGPLTHAGQDQLDSALANGTKLAHGKAGAWVWDRRMPDVDISPLVAATLARQGATAPAKKPSAAFAF